MVKDYKKKSVLKRLYWEEGLSQPDIADKFSMSTRVIEYWMKKHEIPRRKPDQEKDGTFYYNSGYAMFATRVDGDKKHVTLHRLLAVAKYGFDEVKDKVVHHKNGVKWDNRYENIEVMSRAEHTRLHRS